jgi:aldehyde:ferredoxin oxidoreductase
MDSMSAGSIIGFAMEASEKGLLKEFRIPEGIDIKFGNVAASEYLIRAMANRDGELGELLAQGVKQAAEGIDRRLDMGSKHHTEEITATGRLDIDGVYVHGEKTSCASDIAMHTKGLESPAWGPRGASGMALALMTTDRGGCHQRGFPISYEIGGLPWKGKKLDPLSPVDKADLVVSLQNYSAGIDTLVKCDFGSFGILASTYAELLFAATDHTFSNETFEDKSLDKSVEGKTIAGKTIESDIFRKTGERIWNLVRMFNLREGVDSSKDTLPPRFVKEPLPDGPGKGHRLTEEDMAYMKAEYYKIRGWNENGIPLEDTLKRLKI